MGPINPNDCTSTLLSTNDLNGFLLDVEFYAQKVRDIAWKRIGHFFPVTSNGEVVTTWRWAWSVPSPEPRFSNALTPLVSNWVLSNERDNICWVEPIVDIDSKSIRYKISNKGTPPDKTTGRSGAKCLYTQTPISLSYIREQGKQGQLQLDMLAHMTASRAFSSPCPMQIEAAKMAQSLSDFSEYLPEKALGFRVQEYGFKKFSELFTSRQLVVLETFSDIVSEIHEDILKDAKEVLGNNDQRTLIDGGSGYQAYADSIVTILGISVSKMAQSNSILTRWYIDSRNGRSQALPTFDRNAIPMIWDFAETNPFGGSVGDWHNQVKNVLRSLTLVDATAPVATVKQLGDFQKINYSCSRIIIILGV